MCELASDFEIACLFLAREWLHPPKCVSIRESCACVHPGNLQLSVTKDALT